MRYGKTIGIGNTAAVYEWGEGKVLKLFYKGYPQKGVEMEFSNAVAISHMAFDKPKAYEFVFIEDRIGIVYDRIKGESLQDWVLKTGNLQECAIYMADLHKTILQNQITSVPDYKDFLRYNIVKALSNDSGKQEDALRILDKLKDGNTLCHGDFHPGNIFISEEHTQVIDFMNVCHGYFLYDVARTVYLVEYTAVPPDAKDKEMIRKLKKSLSDLYLLQMNVTREMIQDYLTVICIARLGECPNERNSF